MVTRWSRSTSNFYALIGQNLTGEFMWKIYAATWNLFTLTAEADRVLCELVMFFNVFFHWMFKTKCSCYQESSVIHGWFFYWVFGWELQQLETCLLWQLKLTEFCVNLWCFLMSFPTGCIRWNTAAINSLLLFMAGFFIEFLVEKCAACQSQKSDFGWHRFYFSPCRMRVEKSLKRFWPYLIAFRSCISNGKPE